MPISDELRISCLASRLAVETARVICRLRTARIMWCTVINRASQARPSIQAKMTSVSQWWPRKIRLNPIAADQATAKTTDRAMARLLLSRRATR
jgi:hypothetical protein